MVIVTAGMGGGTGTGAAPVVAQIAKEEGCLTVGVVTTPFKFEERDEPAKKGIENLKPWTDSLIVVSNEKVFSIESLSIDNMYNIVDDVLRRSVQAITDVITRTGEINRDFNDVKVVLKDSGTAIVGWGECLDSEDWIEAFNKAVKNNLIESYDISRAKKMLVVLTTPHNVEAIKIQKLFDSIPKSYNSEKRKVLFGHVYEDRLDNKIRLVVIGADFKNQSISRPVIKSHKKEKNEKTEKDNTIDNPQPDLPSLSPQNKTDIKFNEPAYIEWKPTGRLDRK
jgi:cell division protein FtsZ